MCVYACNVLLCMYAYVVIAIYIPSLVNKRCIYRQRCRQSIVAAFAAWKIIVIDTPPRMMDGRKPMHGHAHWPNATLGLVDPVDRQAQVRCEVPIYWRHRWIKSYVHVIALWSRHIRKSSVVESRTKFPLPKHRDGDCIESKTPTDAIHKMSQRWSRILGLYTDVKNIKAFYKTQYSP